MRFILLLVIWAFSMNCYAQKKGDYIVTATNDTVYGELYVSSFYNIKLVVNGVTNKYNDVTAYRKDYIIHRLIKLPGKRTPLWMVCLTDGRIKLYQIVTSNGAAVYGRNVVWYVQKDNSDVVDLKTTALFSRTGRGERKDLLGEFFSDNQAVSKAYEEMNSFSFTTIRELIEAYNKPM